ncbi:hypothetical protein BX600DRAFT_526958 [Xylariales sp. PMI_506]|nr:hypothetical protein BX600DRAFT_526958 [Xylariales sp. PMI_506]
MGTVDWDHSACQDATLSGEHLTTLPPCSCGRHTSCIHMYTRHHLELWHHFEKHMGSLLSTESGLGSCAFDKIIANAIVSPYLMDELLAISALDISTVPEALPRRAEYLCQAAQLHSRALLAFEENVTGSSNLDKCSFYTLSALHSLFDTLLAGDHFSTFLDSFIGFIRLQRKCRQQIQQSPGLLHASLGQLYQTISDAGVAVAQGRRGHECDDLANRLETTTLSPTTLEACLSAVTQLQWVFDMDRQLPRDSGATVHITLAWPMLISDSFIALLEQRCPEALVVLSHYASLLCSCGSLRVFKDSGELLVSLIARHLGSYWRDWLQVDNFVVVNESDTEISHLESANT